MGEGYLVLLSGPNRGQRIRLGQSLTIGRNPDSGLCIEDLQVSRRHAVIEQRPNGIFVRDLGSGNGTYVGERRILEYRLAEGDIIRIGTNELKFELASPSQSAIMVEANTASRIEASDANNVYETFFQAPSNAVTPEQQRKIQERLAAVYKANQIIASERDLHRLFEQVLDQIFGLVPAHNGAILLKDIKTDTLVTEYVRSGSGETVISSTIVNRALENNEAVLTLDAAGDARFGAGASIIAQNICSAMCAPLTHQQERLGVIYVDTRGTPNAFTKSDLELLVALSAPAAIAIKNAQYVHQLERAYHDTLIVIANAIEMRDHYTVGHTWRVTNFGLAIARQLGWPQEQLNICEMGGVLHDVGKIGVMDSILQKASALTDEEYAQMKIHPERGARMLRDVEFLKPLIPYCLYHHERYDGRGYPFGLAGDAIPIEGRLMAVADTFDAMTSNRPYRKGLPAEVAIEELVKGKGTQFDPQIVDACVAAYHAGKISQIIQESQKEGASIVCPWCSTYIAIPDGAKVGDTFPCQVCKRHIRLQQQNEAYYGELLAESDLT